MVELQNVAKKYIMGETTVRALRGLDLKINNGEFVGIVGPSGSGKSTLMHIIGALDIPDQGRVLLDGKDISDYDENELAELRGNKVGFVFQTFNLIHTLSSLDNVALPLTFQGIGKSEREERAAELLEMVGLSDRLTHKPAELSGGEQQRVSIARALINDPDILLADEPTGNLDSETGKDIMELIKGLNRNRGTTIVVVTHNPRDAEYAVRIVNMIDGKIKNGKENEGDN
ncbi:MAG: ABC transporter ATP-binding protein [Candidatus Bipolaricaulota bacterium]|nr:ABC transporter ATP-binding protein [Candidatus Bipolaricaulota bacterium]MBS3791072.1 ABC transporter ATP-binding protein [Candidatus Bipolaricaulota bacterium]